MTSRGLLFLLLSLAMGSAALAQEISGELTLGLREVSVSGSDKKYAEDTNLDDGPRLVHADLSFRPSSDNENAPDLIEIELRDIGDNAFDSARLEVRKYGSYKFLALRQRSSYFYDDLLVLPEEASIEGSTGGDFHRFDFQRVRDQVSFDIDINQRAKVGIGFERFTKIGSSTTTLDVQRDEFELDKPVDEEMRVVSINGRYAWDKFAVRLEQRIRDFDNNSELFLPGFSLGENPTNLTTLDFFLLDQPYSYRSLEHRLNLDAEPLPELTVDLSALFMQLDLDLHSREESQGIDFTGAPFATQISGEGDADRDTQLLTLDMAYPIAERVSLSAGVKYQTLSQNGNFELDDGQSGRSDWDIDTTAYDIHASFSLSSAWAVSLGWAGDHQRIDSVQTQPGAGAVSEDRSVRSDGFFGTVEFRPGKGLSVSASVDNTRVNNPFSLASGRDKLRYRVRLRYKSDNGFGLTASHSMNDQENKTARWSALTQRSTLRLSYTGKALALAIGGSWVDTDRDYQRQVTGGFRTDIFRVAYRSAADYLDASLRYAPSERWVLGAMFRLYDNQGSLLVEREEINGYAEFKLAQGYSLSLSFRDIDYDEGAIEAYHADILEARFRYSF